MNSEQLTINNTDCVISYKNDVSQALGLAPVTDARRDKENARPKPASIKATTESRSP